MKKFLLAFGLLSLSVCPSAAQPVATQSTLSAESSAELQRLLALQTSKKAVLSNLTTLSTKDLLMLDDKRGAPKNALERLLKWNDIALETSALDHTPIGSSPGLDPRRFGEQLGPHKSSRAMGIVHIAMFDAVNAITKRFTSFTNLASVTGPTSIDAAIAKAAHDTLVWLYPSQTIRLDGLYNADRIVGDASALKAGQDLGAQAAANSITIRRNDHADKIEPTIDNIVPPLLPGQWTKDPLNEPRVALGGYWSEVTPFVMKEAKQFRAPPPPKLSDPVFSVAYADVAHLGGDPKATAPGLPTATDRRDGETFVGQFWAYDGTPSLCAPPRLYNQVAVQVALARNVLAVDDMARLLALVNVAMADAGISAWEAKYEYRVQRPVTLIRSTDTAKPSTLKTDPNWTPLGAPVTNGMTHNFTPPFPAYPSGHAVFGGAVFEVLRGFFGVTEATDTAFTLVSDEYNGENYAPGQLMPRDRLPMSFASFADAEYQNARSRIYLGIHWQNDADEGIKQGNKVGRLVIDTAFKPKP
jgi:hypothetical protein